MPHGLAQQVVALHHSGLGDPPHDQVAGVFLEHARGQAAHRIDDDLAGPSDRGPLGDARLLERRRVGPGAVAVEGRDEDWAIGHGGVEHRAGELVEVGEGLVEQSITLDPRAIGVCRAIVAQAFPQLARRHHTIQIEERKVGGRQGQMHMALIESRYDQAAWHVDQLRARWRLYPRVRFPSDKGDTVAMCQNRLRPGESRVGRVDPAARDQDTAPCMIGHGHLPFIVIQHQGHGERKMRALL